MHGTARGTFDVTLTPVPLEGIADDTLLGARHIDKKIHGDLEATTQGRMLMAMTATKGSAAYVAVEHVSGTLEGRQGTFAFVHRGIMAQGAPSLSVEVVPDSGTGGLAGLTGTFQIDIKERVHYYVFDWTLPEG